MAFPVKWIHSGMRGAPQVSGTAGTLIAALDAFLLNGFGQVTALSVTVSGGIATAALNAGQSFDKHAVVLVEGATTPAALNGEARVLTATNSSITWATSAPDGAATGVITIKVAPVGQWEKVFSAANKAVYRSTDTQGARFFYRVDDSGTTAARVRGYESMSDVDTGVAPFPTDAQLSGGGYLAKSASANATAVAYSMVGDSRTVLTPIASASSSNAAYLAAPVRGFGDAIALATGGDLWASMVSCATAAVQQNSYGSFDASVSSPNLMIFVSRPAGGIGSSVAVDARSYGSSGTLTTSSGADGTMGALSSAPNGCLFYSRRYITNGADVTPRANIPGVLYVSQSGVTASIAPGDVVVGGGEMQGRLLLAVGNRAANAGLTSAVQGISLIDISGPWR